MGPGSLWRDVVPSSGPGNDPPLVPVLRDFISGGKAAEASLLFARHRADILGELKGLPEWTGVFPPLSTRCKSGALRDLSWWTWWGQPLNRGD